MMKLNVFVILGIIALFIMPVSAVSMADIRAEGTVSNLTINQTIIGQMNQTPNMTPGPQGIPGINGTNGLNGTPGTTDHHLLTNLTAFDDHTQYALLGGRTLGQSFVGANTTDGNDTKRLQLSAAGPDYSRGGYINLVGNEFSATQGGNVEIVAGGNGNIRFLTQGIDRMNITNAGNLVMGRSDNLILFTMWGDMDMWNYFRFKGDNPYMYTQGFSTPLSINAQKILLNYDSGGKVGIGTASPTAQLDVLGSIRERQFTTGISTYDSGGNVSSQPYLAGTKVYYVSDTLGGLATRKLTFTNGILTAET